MKWKDLIVRPCTAYNLPEIGKLDLTKDTNNCPSCIEVRAYKSLDGSLYPTEGACLRANETYKKNKLESRLRDIFSNFIRYPDPYSLYGYSEYAMYSKDQADKDANELVNNWKLLRSMLNEIQE